MPRPRLWLSPKLPSRSRNSSTTRSPPSPFGSRPDALIPPRCVSISCQLHQGPICWCRARVLRRDPPEWTQRRKSIRTQSRALEHKTVIAVLAGLIEARNRRRTTNLPNHSSAVLKRLCRKRRGAELPSRTCLELEVPRDLAGAPIQSDHARTTSDPKSASREAERRVDTFRRSSDRRCAAAGESCFRGDRIQRCYAVVGCELHEPILILADVMAIATVPQASTAGDCDVLKVPFAGSYRPKRSSTPTIFVPSGPSSESRQ